MAHGVTGGRGKSESGMDVLTKLQNEKISALVVNDVKVITRELKVDVPVINYVDEEQIRYITKEETQNKFITTEVPNTKYNTVVENTIKYNVEEKPTFVYIPKDVEVERPVLVDKEYERPVVKEKVIELVTYKDVLAIKELMRITAVLIEELKTLCVEMDKLRQYKLVEEEVKVPKVNYVPVEVDRVVWKDIPRERCKECGRIQ